MIDASVDMFDSILPKGVFKSALCVAVFVSLVGIELSSPIGQHLSSILARLA
jgi:hypothetical protein